MCRRQLMGMVAIAVVAWWAGATGGQAQTSLPLVYGGGAVMTRATSYVIFWWPAGVGSPPARGAITYQDLVTRYLKDVGDTPLYSLLSQYAPPTGPSIDPHGALAGTDVDTRSYPRRGTSDDPLQGGDVVDEVARVAAERGWPVGPESAFYVFAGRGVQACRDSSQRQTCTFAANPGICSWHASAEVGGQPLIYAFLPYVADIPGCAPTNDTLTSPNSDTGADTEIGFVSHEQFEMITDPLGQGWQDTAGAEIADKCQGQYGGMLPDGGDVTLHGHPYLVQTEWSNEAMGCVLAGAPAATNSSPSPVAATASGEPVASATATMAPTVSSIVTPTASPLPLSPVPGTRAAPATPRVAPERCSRGHVMRRGRCVRRRRAKVGKVTPGRLRIATGM